MQLDKCDAHLLDVLNRAIKDLERVEDDPKTMNFIARRVGNIVKHMKDLRDDLRPRGGTNGTTVNQVEGNSYSPAPAPR